MTTIHTENKPTLYHYRIEIGDGSGVLKPNNKLHVEAIPVLAENEKLMVLDNNYFTILSKEYSKYSAHTCVGKESIHIYTGDSCYGSAVHYTLYSFTKVRASTIRKHIEAAIQKKYGSLFRMDLSCIAEPVEVE